MPTPLLRGAGVRGAVDPPQWSGERSRARTCARLARQPPAARCVLERGEHQLRGATRPRRPASRCACSTTDGTESRPAHPLTEQTLGIWHGAVPGRPVGPALRLPRRRPVGAGTGACGSTRPSCCSTPTPGRSAATSSPTRRSSAPRHGTTGCAAGRAVRDERDSAPYVPRSVVVARRLRLGRRRPAGRRRRGATRSSTSCTSRASPQLHTGSPSELRGTYAGLAHPPAIDYLKDLGVTAVELLPVHQFVTEPRPGAARADQLLGLQHDRLLRPARRATPPPATAASRSREFKADGARRCTPPASR